MRTVAVNSIIAYHCLNLSKRQQEVADVFSLGCLSDVQVADYLGYTVNRVTGRISELLEKGVLVHDHDVIGQFGKPVRMCRLKNKAQELF